MPFLVSFNQREKPVVNRIRPQATNEFEIGGRSIMPINASAICDDVVISYPDLVNIYGCSIGSGTRIGPFVEIQKNSTIGARCKISSHSFICEGVTIEDEVMVAHGVMFTNGLYPRATNSDGSLQRDGDWECTPTLVKRGAALGSNSTIVCGVTIGENALVGAGAVVTRDVPDFAVVAGVPARVIGDVRREPAPGRHANSLRNRAAQHSSAGVKQQCQA
jgi:acetyltransferase-like isoleucine patch superfamily enzyme